MKNLFVPALLSLASLASANSLKLEKLPPALRQAITENAKGGEIKNISSEKENGVTEYEVETILNGKHRDLVLDQKGKLVSVEEEVALESIPSAAKMAIEKKVGAGKLDRVETVTKEGKVTYEAAFTPKKGKKQEYQVTAEGAEVK